MALSIESQGDSPEVAAVKERVREVAERYATRHNWCSVVKQALEEAGINAKTTVATVFTFTVSGSEPQTARKRFATEHLVGKTDEEQRAWVAQEIAPKVKVAGMDVTLPVEVLTLDNDESGLSSQTGWGGVNAPEGFLPFYTSREGRVAHLLTAASVPPESREEPQRYALWLGAQRMSNMRLMCSSGRAASFYNTPALDSPRSEGRICTECAQRAARAS